MIVPKLFCLQPVEIFLNLGKILQHFMTNEVIEVHDLSFDKVKKVDHLLHHFPLPIVNSLEIETQF